MAERTELQSAKHRLSTLAVRNEIVHEGLEVGARVEKEQPLYTIKTPDFIQAESNLIGAAPTFDLTKKELERVMACRRVSRREEVQAISDEQTADGALKAAWDAVPPVRNVCASFLESRPRRRDRALQWCFAGTIQESASEWWRDRHSVRMRTYSKACPLSILSLAASFSLLERRPSCYWFAASLAKTLQSCLGV